MTESYLRRFQLPPSLNGFNDDGTPTVKTASASIQLYVVWSERIARVFYFLPQKDGQEEGEDEEEKEEERNCGTKRGTFWIR